MSKLKSKQEVIERYWPDFLKFCIRQGKLDKKYPNTATNVTPTVDNFWHWYITDGPLGLKDRGLFYNEDKVEYL